MKKKAFCIILLIFLLAKEVRIEAQGAPPKAFVVNPLGDSILPVKTIRELSELKTTDPNNLEICNFVFYMTSDDHSMIAHNNSAKFNKDILEEIKTLKVDIQWHLIQ